MSTAAPQGLASDLRSLESIRSKVRQDPKAAVREAAKQFETLFMQELMKSMRATTMDSGLLGGGNGGELATGMLDQQMAGQMAGMKGGLADAIARQLERQMGMAPGPIPAIKPSASMAPIGQPADRPARIPERGAAAFV